MKELIRELKVTSEKLQNLKDEVQDARAELEHDMEEVFAEIETLSEKVDELKSQIEPLVIEEWKKDKKNKKFYGGLALREKQFLTYKEADALRWAMDKHLCLKLDKKAFEKVADTMDIEGVTKDKEPQVTYPKTIKLED